MTNHWARPAEYRAFFLSHVPSSLLIHKVVQGLRREGAELGRQGDFCVVAGLRGDGITHESWKKGRET